MPTLLCSLFNFSAEHRYVPLYNHRYIPWCVVSLQPQVYTLVCGLSTTAGTYCSVWSLYNHMYTPWCVVSLQPQVHTYLGVASLQPQVHTLLCGLSITTGIYIPWCVVSLQPQVHTLVCGISTTTGTYHGTFSLQPQVHTLVPSLYNFWTESRYWRLLYTASVLSLDIGAFSIQLLY